MPIAPRSQRPAIEAGKVMILAIDQSQKLRPRPRRRRCNLAGVATRPRRRAAAGAPHDRAAPPEAHATRLVYDGATPVVHQPHDPIRFEVRHPASRTAPTHSRRHARALQRPWANRNVSTSLIAAELGISAGNLHYHFRRKDDLSAALLEHFVDEFDALLPPRRLARGTRRGRLAAAAPAPRNLWRYRFLFRDLSGIMTRDRRAAHRLAGVFARAVQAARGICLGLVEQGTMAATAAEIDALADNIAVVALYWLSFDSARHPRQEPRRVGMARGVYQVLMLVAPFLQVESRIHLERLAPGVSCAPLGRPR